MNDYKPEPGIALVKLIPRFGGIKAPDKKWDSITQGEIVKVGNIDEGYEDLVGRIGYWEEFKDSVHLEDNYAFIKLNDILGTSKKE